MQKPIPRQARILRLLVPAFLPWNLFRPDDPRPTFGPAPRAKEERERFCGMVVSVGCGPCVGPLFKQGRPVCIRSRDTEISERRSTIPDFRFGTHPLTWKPK